MPVPVPAAKTATVSTAKTTSVQASEAATMPGAEAATVPAAEAPPVPCVGPMGARCVPASAVSGPGMAEMSDRRTRSDGREAASHVTAMPPFGADRREGQDGRADKKREGGRAEDDKGRCHGNDDLGRR